jgi:hypothetical protein
MMLLAELSFNVAEGLEGSEEDRVDLALIRVNLHVSEAEFKVRESLLEGAFLE